MYNSDMYGDGMYGQYQPRNSMARASFILGIISIVFCSIFYISLPCGALAILCAVLSRTGASLPRKCRFAIISGACGILATLVITGAMVKNVLTDPEMRSYLEYYLQAYTGDYSLDLEEELSDAFPFLSGLFKDETDEEDNVPESIPQKDETEEQPSQNTPAIPSGGEGVFL